VNEIQGLRKQVSVVYQNRQELKAGPGFGLFLAIHASE
jgi:hypothetical protein